MNGKWNDTKISTLLNDNEMRATPQRIAICKKLLMEKCHRTPNELHEELCQNFPTISPNTVYLTLSQLESAGLIRRFYVDGQAVYDSNTEKHDHIFCRVCKLLLDVDTEKNAPIPKTTEKWSIEWGTRVWSGVCPQCH